MTYEIVKVNGRQPYYFIRSSGDKFINKCSCSICQGSFLKSHFINYIDAKLALDSIIEQEKENQHYSEQIVYSIEV